MTTATIKANAIQAPMMPHIASGERPERAAGSLGGSLGDVEPPVGVVGGADAKNEENRHKKIYMNNYHYLKCSLR